jgi:aldose 1-epimerase
MHPPYGEQYRIARGDYAATISGLGGALREFSYCSNPILWGSPKQSLPIGSAGQILAPWPNRLADGEYVFHGVRGTAPLDEPLRHNAIHGLVRWLYWDREYLERDRVKLRCNLAPQPAYPFHLSLAVLYELRDDGLVIRVEAEAKGREPLPFGIGFHPYFLGDRATLARARLLLPARTHYVLDERGLPVGVDTTSGELVALNSVAGLDLVDARLDDCFGGLVRDETGIAVIRYVPGDGDVAEVVMRLGPEFDYVMCYTGDTLPEGERRRAVAIEPMTCAPNAFVSGDGVRELNDAAPFIAEFSIEVHATAS